jgi:hypothetical protein
MEHLFSPCTRLQDMLEDERGHDFDNVNELNLDISTEELLSAERAFTYADLYAMLENGKTVAWLTPHTAVVRVDGEGACYWGELRDACYLCFSVDGKAITAFARSHEHLLEICDVVLRLLAASVAHSVILYQWISRDRALINATSLEYVMEQCQSLKLLSLHDLALDENHCRVLGTYSRSGLEIELEHCRIRGAAAETLAEVLKRNQGPTEIYLCEIDHFVLADALRGNSRLKSLTFRAFNRDAGKQELLAISSALKENKGLVDLHLWYDFGTSYETWGAICDSLETHPTLEVLEVRNVNVNPSFDPSVVTSRVQALVDMLKGNMLIHTIRVNAHYLEHELFRRSVIPHLESNRFRLGLLAIQRTCPIAYRAKVLGQALLAARTDPNRFWMLLSGNPEVAFPSRTTTIAAAASVPTPAATAASDTAAIAVTTASTVTAIRAASTTDASALDIVATPISCQKRKARP